MSRQDKLNLLEIRQDYETLVGAIDRLPSNLEEVKEPISNLKHDIAEAYREVLNVLTPFYSIGDQAQYDQLFDTARSNFWTQYTDASQNIDPARLGQFHISCTKLSLDLDTIHNATKDKKIRQIIESNSLWFQDDILADIRVQNFFSKLNETLKKAKSYNELQSLLSHRDDFNHLKSIITKVHDE